MLLPNPAEVVSQQVPEGKLEGIISGGVTYEMFMFQIINVDISKGIFGGISALMPEKTFGRVSELILGEVTKVPEVFWK